MKKILLMISVAFLMLGMASCSSNTYKVTFETDSGELIKEESVSDGESAIAPTAPEKEGYTFKEWDKDFSNVTSDMVVKAVYEQNVYTVKFYDVLENVIKEEKVAHGAAATAPTDTYVIGYEFLEWDVDFSIVTSDLNVYGIYAEEIVKTYFVTFYDYDKMTFLGRVPVKEGETAVVPKIPTREGYIFSSWDTDFTNVTSDLNVYAVYTKTYDITFVDFDGTVLEVQTVITGTDAAYPASNPTREGYIFSSWDKGVTSVTADIIVTAIYEKDPTKVIIDFIDYDGRVIDTKVIDKGSDVPLPEDPVREGYTFLGWDKSETNLQTDAIFTPKYILTNITDVEIEAIYETGATMLVGNNQTITTLSNIGYHEATFTSSDETVATITSDGVVTALKIGFTNITATIKGQNNESSMITIYVIEGESTNMKDLLAYLASINEERVIHKRVIAYGYQDPGSWVSNLYGSVSKYYFGDVNINTEFQTEINNVNRPGTKKSSIEFITVHDTASMAESATALSHAKYVQGGGGGTSWGYSVGNDGIYYQLPDDEISYHAGDNTNVPYSLTDTGVKADGEAIVTIEGEYYYINGQKTAIKIPVIGWMYDQTSGYYRWTSDGNVTTRMYKINSSVDPKNDEEAQTTANSIKLTTERINDQGLHVVVGENGNYYMGATYFNGTYKYIANRGGNLNSIGMETMVNKGSDLYLTWHYTAFLCAKLMNDYNLDITRVKPHHFFSGKDCPMTMRGSGLWDNLLELTKAEYEINSKYKDYSIEFISHNPKLLSNNGRVLMGLNYDVTVKYTLIVTNNITNEKGSITLSSIIPGSYN